MITFSVCSWQKFLENEYKRTFERVLKKTQSTDSIIPSIWISGTGKINTQ